MSIKINALEIENTKRIKAVKLEPTANGLTVIGGKNNQGKTSVLDSIAWALGGNAFKPSEPQREGSVIPPALKVTMSNGLVVERKGKNSELKVTDPSGKKAGQQLLDTFVEKLALNLPKFMEASGKDKAKTLLQIIGVEDQLEKLDREEKALYQERLYIGRTVEQKAAFAREMPYYPDAPKDLVSASDLIREQQEILARNGENQRKRQRAAQLEEEAVRRHEIVKDLSSRLEEAKKQHLAVLSDLETARKSAFDLQDESTEELERSIENVEEINQKVRANLDKKRADDDAKEFNRQYEELSAKINIVRKQKLDLLSSADLPLPELSVEDGELVYKGQKWDNMSGSEQLMVATAIIRKLNPECGFILLDKLEQMDLDTLKDFGVWLEQEGLQAIATRVSTGDECSIIIEDGYAVTEPEAKLKPQLKDWKGGF